MNFLPFFFFSCWRLIFNFVALNSGDSFKLHINIVHHICSFRRNTVCTWLIFLLAASLHSFTQFPHMFMVVITRRDNCTFIYFSFISIFSYRRRCQNVVKFFTNKIVPCWRASSWRPTNHEMLLVTRCKLMRVHTECEWIKFINSSAECFWVMNWFMKIMFTLSVLHRHLSTKNHGDVDKCERRTTGISCTIFQAQKLHNSCHLKNVISIFARTVDEVLRRMLFDRTELPSWVMG